MCQVNIDSSGAVFNSHGIGAGSAWRQAVLAGTHVICSRLGTRSPSGHLMSPQRLGIALRSITWQEGVPDLSCQAAVLCATHAPHLIDLCLMPARGMQCWQDPACAALAAQPTAAGHLLR